MENTPTGCGSDLLTILGISKNVPKCRSVHILFAQPDPNSRNISVYQPKLRPDWQDPQLPEEDEVELPRARNIRQFSFAELKEYSARSIVVAALRFPWFVPVLIPNAVKHCLCWLCVCTCMSMYTVSHGSWFCLNIWQCVAGLRKFALSLRRFKCDVDKIFIRQI